DIYQNPKFIKMMQIEYPIMMEGARAANIGDNSGTAGINFTFSRNVILAGFKATKLPIFAQMLYFANGNTTEGLSYDIFTKDPESLQKEVKAVIETYGELDLSKSMLLTGFGLAALRGGVRYKDVTATTQENTLRDWWIYFGGGLGHKHNDMLNLGLGAFGLNMAPDLGYPAETGGSNAEVRDQWVSGTISHNTVVVNEKRQKATSLTATPLHFEDAGKVKVIDVDAPYVYPDDVDTYRRTLVSVDIDDSVSYAVDFFRIVGGYEHVYSFHSQSIDATVTGVELKKQPRGTYAGESVPYGDTTSYGKNGGYNWLDNVSRAANPGTGTFTADFKQMDYYKLLSTKGWNLNQKDWHLKMTMLNNFDLADVTLAHGHPPKYGTNPEYLKYVLAKRKGTNLDTLFTTVFEPYIGNSAIKSLERVAVTHKDGSALSKDEPVAAVKVTLNTGRVDYIVYSASKAVTYNIDGKFDFAGTVGVYTVGTDGKVARTYLLDGTQLGETKQQHAVATGTVEDFTKEPSYNNYIDVKLTEDVDISTLPGKLINVANSGKLNGSYLIVDAESVGDNVRLGIGDVTTISGYVNDNNRALGYTFNISEGNKFEIPLSTSIISEPKFESIETLSVSAGSSISIPVKVTGENNLTFDTSGVPRGMSFNEESMTLRWKPDNSQIGDNHVALTVCDGTFSDTLHFIVSVYGSTTSTPSNDSKEDGTGSGGGSGTGGGGGGGASVDKPETGTQDDESGENDGNTENEGNTDNKGTENETLRFIDLASYDWAADAINTLADEGIIKGTTSNTFAPGTSITRADFALLLVRAFGKASDNTENFSDVLDTDYFAKELAIARNTGMVSGVGENKFAPRKNIKRCDMMLMVYRVLMAEGIKLEIKNIEMPDFDTVPEYAKEAVSALVSAGLVNGKNGRIAPNDNTTRAEVAVLLLRLLDFVGKK
ncbi:MAG: S-layer homology domain-containing protein, partial [Oscillospiraceae bacterium]|nr:S-layer homology domain-containing protein [Oscillospiraceae bacterium]